MFFHFLHTVIILHVFSSFPSNLTFLIVPFLAISHFLYLISPYIHVFLFTFFAVYSSLCSLVSPPFSYDTFCRLMTEMTNVTANVGGCFARTCSMEFKLLCILTWRKIIFQTTKRALQGRRALRCLPLFGWRILSWHWVRVVCAPVRRMSFGLQFNNINRQLWALYQIISNN